jgi:hypothetical protein
MRLDRDGNLAAGQIAHHAIIITVKLTPRHSSIRGNVELQVQAALRQVIVSARVSPMDKSLLR